jgi:hypothetical protein
MGPVGSPRSAPPGAAQAVQARRSAPARVRGRIAPDSRFLGRLRRFRRVDLRHPDVRVGSPLNRAAWGGAGGSGAPDRHHPDGWGRIAPDSRPLGRAGGPGRRRADRRGKTHPPRCTAVRSPSAATDALQSPSQRGVGMMPETSAPYRRAALPATPNRCIIAPPASPPAAAAAERRDRRAKTNPPTRTHARRGAGTSPTSCWFFGE